MHPDDQSSTTNEALASFPVSRLGMGSLSSSPSKSIDKVASQTLHGKIMEAENEEAKS